jgi:hypothetical protein
MGIVVHRLLSRCRSQASKIILLLLSTTQTKMGPTKSPTVCFSQHLNRWAPDVMTTRVQDVLRFARLTSTAEATPPTQLPLPLPPVPDPEHPSSIQQAVDPIPGTRP